MAKQRWRQTPDRAGEPLARTPLPAGAGRRKRWQYKPDGPKGPFDRRALRAFLALFSLTMVVALIVLLVWMILPPARPHLTVVSAEYRNSLLDPNAFALADANALLARTDVFARSVSSAPNFDRAGMAKQIENVRNVEPRRAWFFGEPTVAVVYVNAMGFALWEGASEGGRAVPYIAPMDFKIPAKEKSQAGEMFPVGDLLRNLLDARADRKILVLDCQRMDGLWQIGVLENRFVDAVRREIQALAQTVDPKRLDGLYVLASCSEGEVAWPDRRVGRSVFAHFFLEGLSGAADQNHDDRVTFGELVRYTRDQVRNWSRNRADVQTPVLLFPVDPSAAAAADSLRLASVRPSWLPSYFSPESSDAVRPQPAPTDDKFLDELETQWEQYFRLAEYSPRPWRVAPVAWRLLGETLRDAEEFYRAADLHTAKRRLLDADGRRRDVVDRIDALHADTGFSIPLAQFVRDANRKFEDQSPRSNDAPYRKLLDDLVQNRDFDAFLSRCAAEGDADVVPVEAYLAMQFHQERLAKVDADAGADAVRESAARLVRLRRSAEQAPFEAGVFAPQVHYWIRPRMDRADPARRLLEDRFLAEGRLKQKVRVGPERTPESSEGALEAEYADVARDARVLADAQDAREAALADLPNFVRFAARRPWTGWRRTSFQDDFQADFDALLEALARLNARLLAGPANQSPDEIPNQIAAIKADAEQLRKRHASIQQRFETEIRELGATADGPQIQSVWRRISDLMLVPTAVQSPDPARRPKDSARLRVNLLRRVCLPVVQTGAAAASAPGEVAATVEAASDEERIERAQRLVRIARAFFQVAIGQDHPMMQDKRAQSSRNVDEIGRIVGDWNREARFLAVEKDVDPADRREMFQADAAVRLVDASLSRVDLKSRDYQLRRYDLAYFFDWHANRCLDDFWAGRDTDRQHYFQRAGEVLLRQARDVHPSPDARQSAFPLTAKTLARRIELANGKGGANLSPQAAQYAGDTGVEIAEIEPERLEFRLADVETVLARIHKAADLPAGEAFLAGAVVPDHPPSIRVENGRALGEFRVTRDPNRPPSSSGPAAFEALLYFRGHKRLARAAVSLEDAVLGPAVEYSDDRGDLAQFSVRGVERQGLKLLLVLDCSESMKQIDPASQKPRIDILKDVLRDLCKELEKDNIEIGVRLFGSQYYNRDVDDVRKAHTDSIRVLDVAPLNVREFTRIVDEKVHHKGFTPLYYALLQAAGDFEGVRGDRQIIVVSDGADSTQITLAELKKKGIPAEEFTREMVERRFAGANIPIHAIGFLLDEKDATIKRDLKALSDATQGAYFLAQDARSLLTEIKRIARYRYQARRVGESGESVPDPPENLTTLRKLHDLNPGRSARYDVVVADGQNRPKASKNILVRRGDKHDLELEGDRLEYDQSTLRERHDVREQGGVELHLKTFVPRYEDKRVHLDVEFALYKPADPAWDVQTVHVFVTPKGREEERYACHLFEPNIPGLHYPGYRIELRDWPPGASSAELAVSWDEAPLKNPIRIDARPGERLDLEQNIAAGGFQQLTAPDRLPGTTKYSIRIDFREHLKTNANLPREAIQEWFVRAGGFRVRQARQVYGVQSGIYLAEMVVEAASGQIDKLQLYHFDPKAAADTTLKIGFRVPIVSGAADN
jgi:hypothetical protein